MVVVSSLSCWCGWWWDGWHHNWINICFSDRILKTFFRIHNRIYSQFTERIYTIWNVSPTIILYLRILNYLNICNLSSSTIQNIHNRKHIQTNLPSKTVIFINIVSHFRLHVFFFTFCRLKMILFKNDIPST